MYDIAIIGLGPAGATLARSLDSRFRVLAVDRRGSGKKAQKPPQAGKCCGGLLATDAQKSLAKFGLTLPRDVLVDPQIFAVRTIDLHRRLERYYQRFYINLDRCRFDGWLRSMIPDRVEVREGAVCTHIRRERGAFVLRLKENGLVFERRARVVIGADGAGGIVRRTFYPENPIRRYVSIQEWYEQDKGSEPFYAAVFDPDITDCYSWTIHKDGMLVVGAALPDQKPSLRFQKLKHRLRSRGYRFGPRVRREGCFVYRPTGPGSFVTGRDGAYLVGEAAGFISPSSLEGISYAMDSAYLLATEMNLAPCVATGEMVRAGKRYAADTLAMRLKLSGKILKTPFLYHPLLRGAVMATGLDSIEIV